MMRITTACLVVRQATAIGQQYYCTAIADPVLTSSDVVLSTAIRTLKKEAKLRLESVARTRDQPLVNRWIFDSEWQTTTVDLFISLPDRTVKARLPFILQPFGAKLMAQSPIVPGMNLVLSQIEQLESEALEMLPRWIVSQKDWRESDWSYLLIPRDHWIEFFEVEFEPGTPNDGGLRDLFKLFSRQEKMSGAQHLQSIGRCLDDELVDQKGLHGRQVEVDQIETLLSSRKCQSVALIGNPGVGKTSILREVVRRRVARRSKENNKQIRRERVWAVNSQRIVSGMMYLGQWEERWLGILREIHRKNHILFIEDPLGLLTAGKTRDSKLNAADVLTAFTAVHPIRIVTEMTPQAMGILKVRKRELADLFLSFQVEPLKREETLDLVIQRTGEVEVQRRKFFHPGTLPLMISSTDRYFRSEAFPGKVVQIMDDLCRDRTSGIAGREVIASIQKRTGLKLTRAARDTRELERDLKSRVVGQDDALDKLLRFMVRANAGLQPDDRPLGVFLCLGPTGVGKTETAKAIAEVMFEGEHHLLRFDMNEINSPLAAEQLIGNFEQPDGKLTSAVRRQPFAVILFDEIEKAHPDVFDYLLQVIGEGRLTDAVGRTIDFRDTLILLTSNIGAKEASKSIGFDSSDARAADHYRRAAAAFFRPEFINRLDDILMFRHLSRANIEQIAHIQLGKMIEREGILRRNIFLNVAEDAMNWLIERGYDPQLGARVLKRELERYVAQPLADSLAEESSQTHCLLHIQREGERLSTQPVVLPMKAKKTFVLPTVEATLVESREVLNQLHQQSEGIKEECNFEEKLSKDVIQYYALREQIMLCDEIRKLLDMMKSAKSRSLGGLVDTNIRGAKSRMLRNYSVLHDKLYSEEAKAADDIRDALEVEEIVPSALKIEDLQWLLHAELEFAKAMFESFHEEDEVLLFVRRLTSKKLKEIVAKNLCTLFYGHISQAAREGFGFEVEFSKVVTNVCLGFEGGSEDRDRSIREMAASTQQVVAEAEGLGVIIRGLGARALTKAFEGLWAFQEGRHLMRVGSVTLASTDKATISHCETELQKILHVSDPIKEQPLSAISRDTELRAVAQRTTFTAGSDLSNSDGLTLNPRCSVPLELENPQANNLARRLVLDWMLVDRCGVEVAE
jgi:ATP-dependent Clp protease ATP-binding subunit ClpA